MAAAGASPERIPLAHVPVFRARNKGTTDELPVPAAPGPGRTAGTGGWRAAAPGPGKNKPSGKKQERRFVKPDPIVLRRQVGRFLAQARDAAGLTQFQVCGKAEIGPSTLQRIEKGKYGASRSNVLALLDLYGKTSERTRDQMVAMARASRQEPWHAEFPVSLTEEAQVHLSYEASATSIAGHSATALPPLLQPMDLSPEDLARMKASGHECSSGHLALLAERRRLLAASRAGISYTLDEAVLYRTAGSTSPAAVLRCVRALRDTARTLGADIRIVPFAAGPYPADPDVFTVIDAGRADSIVAAGSAPAGIRADPGTVAFFRARAETLRSASLSITEPERLLTLLARQSREQQSYGPDLDL